MVEHMADGRFKVTFESGEVHRYKPGSLQKLARDNGTAVGLQKSRRRMSACFGWDADSEPSRDRPGRKTEARGDATTRCSGLPAELRKDQQRLRQGTVFAGKLRARAKAAKAKGRGAGDLDFVAV